MASQLDDLYTTIVKHDSEGQRVPARLSGLQYLAVALQGGLRPTEVPPSHWRPSAASPFTVTLACVCDEEHELRAATYVCCECGRVFLYTGTVVWSLVARKSPAEGRGGGVN